MEDAKTFSKAHYHERLFEDVSKLGLGRKPC